MRIVLAGVFLLLGNLATSASPITQVIGTANLFGTTYSVSALADNANVFGDQSFNALLPTITFTTAADAFAAGNQLISEFGPDFDWDPMARGGGGRIAFAATSSIYYYVVLCDCDSLVALGPFTGYDRAGGNVDSFIQFAAVPEPSTIGVLITCVAFFGCHKLIAKIRRRWS